MRYFFLSALIPLTLTAATLRPVNLKCEYRTNPLGIDERHPRLSWALAASDPSARNLRQVAYQLQVASSPEKLAAGQADLWDSGRVASGQSIHVEYAGAPLASGAAAHWRVRAWDQDGDVSDWSAPAHWSMGLLMPADWRASWIGKEEIDLPRLPGSIYASLEKARWVWQGERKGKPTFTKTFKLPAGKALDEALLVMTAAGRWEAEVNGVKTGIGMFTQMPQVFNVQPYLKDGVNSIKVTVDHPNDTPAGLIGALRLTWAGGRQENIVTDLTWTEKGADVGPYGMAPWGPVGYAEARELPARYLRKEFDAPKQVKRAMAYISGLGLYELYLNGARIGDAVLAPNLTDYTKRVFYNTYDVTSEIRSGRNAVGVILGNGRWWAPRDTVPAFMRHYGAPRLIFQLDIEYADGSTARVASNGSWRLTADGPIRANNEYDGEFYDARKEMPKWAEAGFDDSQWVPATSLVAPQGFLAAQMAEPLKVTERLTAKSITQPRPGVWVVDFGQNLVGWCRLKVTGKAGQQLVLRHTETLRADGMLFLDNLRSAQAADTYILKGGGEETYEPRFTYHGFRYAEITGLTGKPTSETLVAHVVHDALERTADFVSSSEMLNRLHGNILWGVRGNYRSIPTDCPQRDERQGWLGDRSVVSRTESYLHDVAAFYNKWLIDIADAQKENGSVPVVAPAYWPIYNDDVTWPSTLVLSTGMLYDQYADRRAVERLYPYLQRWIEHMKNYEKDGLMPRDTYGDWCVPPEKPELIHSQDPARRTDPVLLGTAYFYQMLRQMERYAGILGRRDDAQRYAAWAVRMKAAFQNKFYDGSTSTFGNGTQTSSVLPLAFGLTPEGKESALFQALTRRIETETQGHVGTGLVGAQWLMRALTENGGVDVAFRMAEMPTYPGWGYMVSKGATTVWELWNGDTADPAMNSANHVMQVGDLGVWMYEYLAGIRPDPAEPGFAHTIIRPVPPAGLTSARASHKTLYGTISSAWQRKGPTFEMQVTVPPNTRATIYVPARSLATVKESRGLEATSFRAGYAIFETGSGSYLFTAQ